MDVMKSQMNKSLQYQKKAIVYAVFERFDDLREKIRVTMELWK